MTFSIGKRIFSILIFLISEDESTIDIIAVEVESLMRLKSVVPRMRYSGKFSISKRKKVLKTADRTHIIRRGLSTDHSAPRALLRYLSLKSLDTNEVRINQLRRIAGFDMLRKARPSK